MKKLHLIKIFAFTMLVLGFVAGAGAQGKARDFCDQGQKLMVARPYLQAAEAYKQAIRLQPDLESAHLGLKKAYAGLSYWKQVKEAHLILKDLSPDDAVGHYGLGLLYVQKRDKGYAQDEYQNFCDQGQKFLEAGRYLQAAEAFKQAIRLQPNLEPAHLGLKQAYGGLTYWKQREEAHRLLKNLSPDDAVGHYGLGLLYVQKRDMGYAQDEYQILQKLDPALAPRLDQAICRRK